MEKRKSIKANQIPDKEKRDLLRLHKDTDPMERMLAVLKMYDGLRIYRMEGAYNK